MANSASEIRSLVRISSVDIPAARRAGEGETEREGGRGRKEGQKKSTFRECVKSVNALIVDITAQEFQAAIEGSCKECAHYPIVIYFSLH